MELGSFLAPLWWLWYAIVYVYSHSWALAVSIAAVSSVYLAYRHRQENSIKSVSKVGGLTGTAHGLCSYIAFFLAFKI